MTIKHAKQAVCTALAMLISFTVFTAEPAQTHAASAQTASEVVKDIVFGWNLGNTLDSYSGTVFGAEGLSSETAWGNAKTTQAMIDMVADTEVNAIRVPVTWYNHMDPVTYKIDEAWMNRVEETVNYVLKDNLYCVLNVHHDTGEKGWLRASSANFDKNKEIFRTMWQQIAARFANYSDRLLLEGFNEILDDGNEWVNPSRDCLTNVNTLNQIFVDTVRASGGGNADRILICNTYAASGNPYVTGGFQLPTDTVANKLIAEAHVYQPFYFTCESYPEETTWEQNKQYLDEQLNAIYSNFVQKGIPAIIGEFGCSNTKGNESEILSWAQYYVEKCTGYGIKCFWWDNGTNYKIFNRNTLQISQPTLLSAMLAKATGGTYVVDTTRYGDANGDGSVTVTDVQLLQSYLLRKIAAVANCDMNKDKQINVTDLLLLKQQLIQSENLCASPDSWTSWTDVGNGADADITYLKNGISATVRNGGKNIWDVQTAYKPLTLEQGATYQLSFDYSCTGAQTMDANVMQNYGDYIPYHTVTLDYTPDVQHHTSTFTMTAATDKNTQVGFNFGASDAVPFTITIQNLSLIKLSGGSSTTTPTTDPETPTGTNLCAAATGWGSWVYEDAAAASVTKLGNGLTINVTNAGTEEWHVQGSYSGLELAKNATYRVEFDYSATTPVALGFHVQQNYDPYGQFLYSSLNYTTKVQHFSAEFSMTDAEADAVCVFSCGAATAPFSVTIQNLSLVRIS